VILYSLRLVEFRKSLLVSLSESQVTQSPLITRSAMYGNTENAGLDRSGGSGIDTLYSREREKQGFQGNI